MLEENNSKKLSDWISSQPIRSVPGEEFSPRRLSGNGNGARTIPECPVSRSSRVGFLHHFSVMVSPILYFPLTRKHPEVHTEIERKINMTTRHLAKNLVFRLFVSMSSLSLRARQHSSRQVIEDKQEHPSLHCQLLLRCGSYH